MKTFPFVGPLLVLSLVPLAEARADAPAPTPDQVEITADFVDRLVLEAQGQNPALLAAASRAQAADSVVAGVRTWEDPIASFGLWGSTSRGFESTQEGNLVYGLEQKLPLYGRPDLVRQVAAADASRELLASDFETQKLSAQQPRAGGPRGAGRRGRPVMAGCHAGRGGPPVPRRPGEPGGLAEDRDRARHGD